MSSSRSEIIKIGDPYHDDSLVRNRYFTNLQFNINNSEILLPVKVDTGSSYTVFGLKNSKLERFYQDIIKSNINGVAYDASGNELPLKGFVINNFRLTEDIVFNKIQVFFSETLGERSILGMDILSMFDFQYLRERCSTNGTFWINNYQEVMDGLRNRSLNSDLDYVDPQRILSIDLISGSKMSSFDRDTGEKSSVF